MTTSPHDNSDEGPAVLDAILALAADAPTACSGWSAHDLVAHLAAGAAELADLLERKLDGRPDRPTRPFDPREAPFRAMPHDELLGRLVDENIRMLKALDALRSAPDDSIPFTGTTMTVDRLVMHGRSEAALHRWDLVGSDDVSRRLLAQPALTAHGVWILNAMPVLDESATAMGQRAARSDLAARSVALVSSGEPTVVLRLEGPDPRIELGTGSDADVVVELPPADRLLALWGRRSADVDVQVRRGTDATAVLEAVLWPHAQPWTPRSATIAG